MFPTISVEEVGFLLWACPTAGSWVRDGGGGLRFGLWEEEKVLYISTQNDYLHRHASFCNKSW